jgi:hypothetical protein
MTVFNFVSCGKYNKSFMVCVIMEYNIGQTSFMLFLYMFQCIFILYDLITKLRRRRRRRKVK